MIEYPLITPLPEDAGLTLAYFRERTKGILEVLDHLVRLESPSGSAEAIARFTRAYRLFLEETGVRCEEIPGKEGPVLYGRLDPPRPAVSSPGGSLVIVGHSDTVWPLGEVLRRPPSERDGRYYAPGAYDMKAGLAVAVWALRFLKESGQALACPLEIFLSPDEEIGSLTAHPHMARRLSPESIALVLEPPLPDGSIKAWRKGVGLYRLEVRGREAHAGSEPENGTNAVVEMARRILEIVSWSDPRRGIALNVGEVHGGIATNVVPGSATAGVDTRFDDLEDGDEIDRRLRALQPGDPGASISVSGGIIFPPLRQDARSRELAARAIAVAADLGLGISTGKSGGGSDGSFLAARGLAVLDGLGVEGGGAHAQEEHVLTERLPVRAAFLARLILELGRGSRAFETHRSNTEVNP